MLDRGAPGLWPPEPIDRALLGRLAVWWVVLTATGVVVGEFVTGFGRGSTITRFDQRASEWVAARRTPRLDAVSRLGSALSDSSVKVVATVLVCAVFLWAWRRWHEAALVGASLILEAAAFLTITLVVRRARPEVTPLDDSPVDSSFPSGHTAAATVYAAVAVVVFRHTDRTWARVLSVVLAGALPIVVGASRWYRGMHFVSDIVAGVALGAATLVVTARLLPRPPTRSTVG
ncbi:MAG: phosphatase PAP2 family protein [Acidimicrobiia bacterium]|nr:phosphatase PAP2 family protein [Acidimicrobiia bacterium]